MKDANLKNLSPTVEAFMNERNWDQFHSLKNLAMALSVEASELLEIFQWMSESDSNQINKDPKNLKKVEEELADISVYLIRILQKTGINLEEAIAEKMQKNALKYPVTLSKGVSKKYDDLS